MSRVHWLAAPSREAGRPPAPVFRLLFLTGSRRRRSAPGPGALARRPAWRLPGSPECPVPRVLGGRALAWAPPPLDRGNAYRRGLWARPPPSRGPGATEGRRAESLMCFRFSFQIIGISLSQFNIWIFLFKSKGKGLFVVWVCFVSCASDRESSPEQAGHCLSPATASVCQLSTRLPASGRSAVSFQYLFLCCFYHDINY